MGKRQSSDLMLLFLIQIIYWNTIHILYNSLKNTWFSGLVYSQYCATIITKIPEHFLSPQKRNLIYITSHPLFFPPPAPDNH